MKHDRARAAATVAHVGPVADSPGGIAQVARAMIGWSDVARHQVAVVTTRGDGILSDLRLAPRAVAALVRRRRAGALLLHVHFSQRGSFVREGAYTVLARLTSTPVVAQIHGSGFADFAERRPRLVATVLRRTAAVVCLTQETEDIVRGLVSGRAQVVRTFNAVSDPGPPSSPRREFVFGGVLGRRKGADVLLHAWRAVEQQAVEEGWRLVLCGPPSDDLDPGEARGLRNVEVRGSVPHPELMQLLTSTSCVVLPSRAEAFPMFLAEGMIRGAIPISTDVGDVRRLLGDTGHCLPVEDVPALADALRQVMSLSADQLLLRRAEVREHILRNFDVATAAHDMERVWSDASSR